MNPRTPPATGWLWALGAYLSWGVLPIYFKALRHVSPVALLSHRTVWAAALLAVVVRHRRELREAAQSFRAHPRVYLASSALLGVNWLLFIWAIAESRLLEASLGYFINPLVNVVLGVWFFQERLNRWQLLSVALASTGVLFFALRLGTVPWLSFALALTFALYGLLRKKAHIPPVVGLFVESACLAPFGALYLVWLGGARAFGDGSAWTVWLLLMAGVVTAWPLICFGQAVRRLPLSTIGLLQYLSPLCQFLLAVLAYREPFTSAHAVTFLLIGAAVVVFCVDAWRPRAVAAVAAS